MDFEKNGHGKSWKSHGILNGRRCTNPECSICIIMLGVGINAHAYKGAGNALLVMVIESVINIDIYFLFNLWESFGCLRHRVYIFGDEDGG
jgi:hypothetical protein